MLSRNFSSHFSTFNFSFSRDINSRVHDEMCDLKKTGFNKTKERLQATSITKQRNITQCVCTKKKRQYLTNLKHYMVE